MDTSTDKKIIVDYCWGEEVSPAVLYDSFLDFLDDSVVIDADLENYFNWDLSSFVHSPNLSIIQINEISKFFIDTAIFSPYSYPVGTLMPFNPWTDNISVHKYISFGNSAFSIFNASSEVDFLCINDYISRVIY